MRKRRLLLGVLGLCACMCWAIASTVADDSAGTMQSKQARSGISHLTVRTPGQQAPVVQPQISASTEAGFNESEYEGYDPGSGDPGSPRLLCPSCNAGCVLLPCQNNVLGVPNCDTIESNVVRCAYTGSSPTTSTDNNFAHCWLLAANFEVKCVKFGIRAVTLDADWVPNGLDMKIRVFTTPTACGTATIAKATSTLIAETTINIPLNQADNTFVAADFGGCGAWVASGSKMIVEVHHPDMINFVPDPVPSPLDGGEVLLGTTTQFNADSYQRLEDGTCGPLTIDWKTMTSLGFATRQNIIQVEGVQGGALPIGTCCYYNGAIWQCAENQSYAACDALATGANPFEWFCPPPGCANLTPLCGNGACCTAVGNVGDPGTCTENLTLAACQALPNFKSWHVNQTCAEIIGECGVPPPNDECANAITLSGTCTSATFNTYYASNSVIALDATPPASCSASGTPVRDIWYRWQVPTQYWDRQSGSLQNVDTGVAVISTVGSTFDTMLMAYWDDGGGDCATTPCPTDGSDGVNTAGDFNTYPGGCIDDMVSGVRQFSILNTPCDGVNGPAPGNCLIIRVGGWHGEPSVPRDGGPGQVSISFIPQFGSVWSSATGVCCMANGDCFVARDETDCNNLGGFYRPLADYYEGDTTITLPESYAGCCSTEPCEVGTACYNAIPVDNGTFTSLVHKVMHYKYTTPLMNPGDSMGITIDTCGSGFDTVLSVYAAYLANTGDCDTLVARNDNCVRGDPVADPANSLVSCFDLPGEVDSCMCLSVGFDGFPNPGDVYDLQPATDYYIVVGMKDTRVAPGPYRAEGVDPAGNYPNPNDPEVLLVLTINKVPECFDCQKPCLPGGIPENEPGCAGVNTGCGQQATWDGPLPNPFLFSQIQCGQIVCGTMSNQDSDWYRLVVPTKLTFTFTVNAEFAAEAWVLRLSDTVGDECDVSGLGLVATVNCVEIPLNETLCPGTYYLVVQPNDEVTQTIVCDQIGSNYWATLVCSSADKMNCCKGDTNNDGKVNGQDIARFLYLFINKATLFGPFFGCQGFNFCLADMDNDGWLLQSDIAAFASDLVTKPSDCPVKPLCEDVAKCQLPGASASGTIGATSDLNPDYRVADCFCISEPGNITDVCWWGFYIDFGAGGIDCGTPQPVNNFTITYYNNDNPGGRCPGTLKAGPFNVGAVVGANVGFVPGSAGTIVMYEYQATHAAVAAASGECLWIEIVNNTTGGCLWLWNTSADGDTRGAQHLQTVPPEVAKALPTNYVCPNDITDYDLAFCLNLRTAKDGCGIPTGACCVNGVCVATTTESDCQFQGGAWFDGQTCPGYTCPTEITLNPDTNCASAPLISCQQTVNGTIAGAGAQGTEPTMSCRCCGVQTDTYWYRVQPTATTMTVQTCPSVDVPPGSGIRDSIIALYSGTCAGLVEIACSEDACNGGRDPANGWMSTFTETGLTIGQTYYIGVASYGTLDSGAFKLAVTCP